MIRRVGEPVRPDIRYRIRPGVYAILPHGDGVLLTHQDRPEPELQLPGGGVDPGESPLRALHREVFEETGWRIARPRRLGAYRRFVYMPEYDQWAEKICTIFVAHPALCLGEPGEAGHTAMLTDWRTAATEVASVGDRMFMRQFLR
ncbi:NUDIX hydrolase [Roseovarius sp. SCSIO 43702]|uniref:NUDIX domain-containing protein n=1 Tax=Roseovarius sp. SCSIO 43702 TaxID=2823043 RepID=UPI001C731B02|nr:NUDIX hydrolase [Roseovarius sp. SCSIO 43702]QYX57013.1 NUDIX hydrolase [Roseovarius sp. SCSIO 43702]